MKVTLTVEIEPHGDKCSRLCQFIDYTEFCSFDTADCLLFPESDELEFVKGEPVRCTECLGFGNDN